MQLRNADDGRPVVLQFAQLGFQLVPVHGLQSGACTCSKGSECPKKGKHPKQRKWQEKGSCLPEVILKWWNRSLANLGVVTGSASGIVVVDVDGDEGLKALGDLVKEDDSIRNTRVHRSGSGGLHLFYLYPEFAVGNYVGLLPGVDVRGDAGLIVLPPSLHISGRQYEIIDDREIAPLPDSIRALLTKCHKERRGETRCYKDLPGDTRQVGGGIDEHHSFLTSVGPSIQNMHQWEWAVKGSLPTKHGRRNRQVFQLAQRLFTIFGTTKDTPLLRFRSIVETWYRLAREKAEQLGFTIEGDIEETWSDFCFAWQRVKHAIGGELASVFALVAEMESGGEVNPLVWDVLGQTYRTEQPEMRLLIGVLFELAQLNKDEPFSLACQAGAEQFRRFGFSQVDGTWVHRRLGTLTDEGILVCVDRGKPGARGLGLAAKYRWVWQVRSIQEQGV